MCTKEAHHSRTNSLILSFQEYLQVLKYSKSSRKNYVQSLKTFLNFLSSQEMNDLRAVTKDTIRDYLKYLLEQKERYTVHTVSIKYRAIRHLFEFLEKTNQILINPTTGIPVPSLGKRLPKNVLTKEEIKKILNAPNTSTLVGIRDKTILEVFYSTGIRSNELRNLTVDDVNLEDGYLRVNNGKGDVDRVVPIGEISAKYLRNYLLEIRPLLVKKKLLKELFISKKGNKFGKDTLRLIVKKYAKFAEVKKTVSPHTWRHTCATHMLQNKANIRHIQELLGHKSLDTTMRYTQLTITDLKETHKKHHPRDKEDF